MKNFFFALTLGLVLVVCGCAAGPVETEQAPLLQSNNTNNSSEIYTGDLHWEIVAPKPRAGTELVEVLLFTQMLPADGPVEKAFFGSSDKPRIFLLKDSNAQVIRELLKREPSISRGAPSSLVLNTKTARISVGSYVKFSKALVIEGKDGHPTGKVVSGFGLNGTTVQVTPEVLEHGLKLTVNVAKSRIGEPIQLIRLKAEDLDETVQLEVPVGHVDRTSAALEVAEGQLIVIGPIDFDRQEKRFLVISPSVVAE